MKQYLADFGLLFVGIFWGLGFVFVKIGLNTGVDPFYLSAVRFLVGGIILYGIFFRKVEKFKKNDVLAGLIVGIFQFFGYAFQTYGAMLTTASKNAFFTSINVVIVPYIFWFLHKKRPDIFAFLASVICVMGVAVISFDRKMNLANLNFGDILTIISAIFFSGQIATNGYFSKKVEPSKACRNDADCNNLFNNLLNSDTNSITDILPKIHNFHKSFSSNVNRIPFCATFCIFYIK